jgi:hypothetical protein
MRARSRGASRTLLALALAVGVGAPAAPARADDTRAPSAERIRSAADEFDQGRRAFMAGEYGQAAVHFENAYHDAPRAEVLRNAIRAHRSAKEPARAATLASQAAARYGDDAQTVALVNETLAELSPQLERVVLQCEPECGVAADGRVVSLADAARIAFYLAPGRHDVVVSWSGDRTRHVAVDAVAGYSRELRVVAPPAIVGPVPAASSTDARGSGDLRASAAPRVRRPFGPALFIAGAVLTAAGAGLTIASGIDASNDPGADAVRRDCVGLGEDCATYQRGRSAQARTNILLGATAGVGLVTAIVGVFFTRWSAPRVAPDSAALRITPYVTARGAGLNGRF